MSVGDLSGMRVLRATRRDRTGASSLLMLPSFPRHGRARRFALADPNIWASLVTLTVLEIVLGIDNLLFISIVADRLPVEQRDRARKLGLTLAVITRLMLLASISWMMGLTKPLFTALGADGSPGAIIILIGGGLFLIYKGTTEIHHHIEHTEEDSVATGKKATFGGVLVQIMVLDIVFSLDSVITAVGMADHIWVMATAVIIAVGIMLLAANPVSRFVNANPTVKMLALSFLLLIGMTLVADGLGYHVPKGFIYSAMGFSVAVEALNMLTRRRRRARRLAQEAAERSP
jgi:predicted tellurium resistance membrane protein TerC